MQGIVHLRGWQFQNLDHRLQVNELQRVRALNLLPRCLGDRCVEALHEVLNREAVAKCNNDDDGIRRFIAPP